jgi:hypothetical protein
MRNLEARFGQRNGPVKLHKRKAVHDGGFRKLRLEPTKENAAVKNQPILLWTEKGRGATARVSSTIYWVPAMRESSAGTPLAAISA